MMSENEEVNLMDHNCHICQKVVTQLDFDTLDDTCFVTVHKKCKKNYRGTCPVCHLTVQNKNWNKCIYRSIILLTGSVFTTGLVCFFVLLGEKL